MAWARETLGTDPKGQITSVFKFFKDGQKESEERLRGLVRLTDRGVGRFLAKSGTYAAGIAIFAEPFSWDADASVSPWDSKPACEWIHQDKDEAPLAYLAMCVDDAPLGLTIGIAQLGVRRTAIPGTVKTTVWTVSGCPHDMRDTSIEEIVRAAGFQKPQIVGRLYHNSKGMTWRERAGLAGDEDYR